MQDHPLEHLGVSFMPGLGAGKAHVKGCPGVFVVTPVDPGVYELTPEKEHWSNELTTKTSLEAINYVAKLAGSPQYDVEDSGKNRIKLRSRF